MIDEHPDQPLTSLVQLAAIGNSTYELGGLQLHPGDGERESAAQLLADDAMQIRCGNSPLLELWRLRRNDGPKEPDSRTKALKVYAGLGFGLPEEAASEDHLQGLVAELFWNRLIKERKVCPDSRALVHAHSVKPDPLEPGGDGLAIYRRPDGVLVFRLWEIKKHARRDSISGTIGRASKQLVHRGHEYLAKLAGPETIEQGGDLGSLYAEMVELWIDQTDRAGVGVSISTSSNRAPKTASAFGSILRAFPAYAGPGQAEGLVIAMPEFPQFAKRVRKIVWSGL